MEFVMSNYSGKQLSRFIKRNLEGTWASIADEAEELFGSRGRIIAVLLKPKTMQETKKGCEGILKDAGLSVERALSLTDAANTFDGFHSAILRIRALVEDDICINILALEKCDQVDCTLKHKILI
jgi:hypothetical protein